MCGIVYYSSQTYNNSGGWWLTMTTAENKPHSLLWWAPYIRSTHAVWRKTIVSMTKLFPLFILITVHVLSFPVFTFTFKMHLNLGNNAAFDSGAVIFAKAKHLPAFIDRMCVCVSSKGISKGNAQTNKSIKADLCPKWFTIPNEVKAFIVSYTIMLLNRTIKDLLRYKTHDLGTFQVLLNVQYP